MNIEDLETGDNVLVRLRGADRDMDTVFVGRFLERINYGRGVMLQLRFKIAVVNGEFLERAQVLQWPLDKIRRVDRVEVVA